MGVRTSTSKDLLYNIARMLTGLLLFAMQSLAVPATEAPALNGASVCVTFPPACPQVQRACGGYLSAAASIQRRCAHVSAQPLVMRAIISLAWCKAQQACNSD